MRTRRALVPWLLAAALPAAAQTPVEQRLETNSERGFVAEKVYQFDSLDSVNLFNGNLTVTLPLGGTYPVSSNLSYGLKLYYNSKIWELQYGGGGACTSTQEDSFAAFPARFPHHGASAGLGWTFSLGHFIPRSLPSPSGVDTYVSPDGAAHTFVRTAVSIPGYSWVAHSKRSTNLRLRVTSGSPEEYEIEFPDGTIHLFGSDGFIKSMKDRSGNAVAITTGMESGKWKWVLTDAHRTQTVTLADAWPHLDSGERFESLRWIVESVELAAFSPQGTSQPTGKYLFEYTYAAIARGCAAGFSYAPCTDFPEVPLLKSITWEPDGSTFGFTYNTAGTGACDQGTLKRLTLPTGGAIEWTYGEYYLPANGCATDTINTVDWRNSTPGVIGKTLYAANSVAVGTWQWNPEPGARTTTWNVCPDVIPPGGSHPERVPHLGHQQVTNTVTDPLGRQTVHYFATWDMDAASGAGNLEMDYGLPYTRLAQAANAPGTRYLSRQICKDAVSPCSAARTLYVEYDQGAPRQVAEHTVFNDDPGDPAGAPTKHYVDTAFSNYDGHRNYRQTVVSSTFGPKRTSFRDYNGNSGTATFDPADPWLIDRYTLDSVTENGNTTVSHVCFDTTTGVLLGRRWLKGTDTDAADVLVRYGYSSGDRVSEDWYGGDESPIVSNELCHATGAETSHYRLDHEYTAGVRRASTYRNATFKSLDATVDSRSGLASATRDPAGSGISYKYDALGRVTEARPAGEAWTHYSYDTAGRETIVRTYAASVTDLTVTPAPAPLTERRIYYDGLGRVAQIRNRMPAGWSVTVHKYDEAGRRTGVSMPELRAGSAYEAFTPAHETSFTFDRFGRTLDVTTPDGKTATTRYTGARIAQRAVEIDGTVSTTSETYDAHGRLISVVEGALSASYGYDAANRLISVSSVGGGVEQKRTFLYDNRGFLLAEAHPEKGRNGNGAVLYGAFEGANFEPAYDPRGHATRRIDDTQGGAYDLKLTYDHAERLIKVEDLGAGGARRTLEEFTYGTQNNPVNCTPGAACNALKGKLASAVRYHYLPDLGTVAVTESYEYTGLGGRPTRRTTTVTGNSSFAGATFTLEQSWNELGLPLTITYPATTSFAAPSRTVTNSYSDGLLTGVAGYAAISYQANGLIDTVTHGNTVAEKWIADPHGMSRPRRIEVTGPSQLWWAYGDYSFDGAGNIVAIGTRSFDYDAMNRLVAWTDTTPTSFATTRRQLDPFGNYLDSLHRGCSSRANGGQECHESATLALAVNAASNHYTSESYDDAGSVVADTAHTYSYDGAGSMIALTGRGRNERYLYTADDERIAMVDLAGGGKTTWTLRAIDHRLLRTFTRAGTATTSTWSWTEDEIWRGSHLLAGESPSGRKYYHLDHLGSPRLITDASGRRLGEQTFAPFGEGGTRDGGRLQFTGYERDHIPAHASEGGRYLDYAHARYYSPLVGRFLSVDPGLDIKRAVREPQSWNRYSYVVNNPINRIDPDGRVDQNWDGGAARQLFPGDRAAQLEFEQDVAKKTAIGAGVSLGVMGVIACGPSCWKAAAVGAWNWAQRNPGTVQQGMQAVANLAAPPGVSPIPVSAGNLKHIRQHLGAFQKLDSKMTLDGVVNLGRTIASNADNLVGTPGGRKVFEAVVKIGDQNVTVRAVLNTEGGLRSVHIRY